MATKTKYTLAITTTSERYVEIEILDERFTIERVKQLIESGDSEGTDFLFSVPCDEGEAGTITCDGKAVARYEVMNVIDDYGIEGVYDAEGRKVDINTVAPTDLN